MICRVTYDLNHYDRINDDNPNTFDYQARIDDLEFTLKRIEQMTLDYDKDQDELLNAIRVLAYRTLYTKE